MNHSLTPFRVYIPGSGWVQDVDDNGGLVFVPDKFKARILDGKLRSVWLVEDGAELVDLETDEILAQVGAPRLPGF